jgi:plastocyanin
MKQKQIVSTIFILLVFVVVGFIVWRQLPHKTSTKSVSKTPAALPQEVTIELEKNGFSPNEVTIKVGTAVRWKNVSGDKQTVNSDDYPTNQLHKKLNFGIFNDGSSVVYIFKTPGVYGYHNQFHPNQKGMVIVR